MPSMNEEIHLLQFSDPHLFASVDGALRGVPTYRSLERVLAHARQAIAKAQVLLFTGDIVNDEPAGYAHFQTLTSGLGKPVLCLPGNHDERESMHAALSRAPYQVGGVHDLGSWRIVMLDSSVAGQAHGRLGNGELALFEDALRTAGEKHVLACVHHHPIRMASRWLDSVGLQNADEFLAIADHHPQLRAIAWGHVHQSLDTRRKGVRLLAVPSTCAQFLPGSEHFAIDPSPPGYRRMTLRSDGTIDTEVIRLPEEARSNGHLQASAG
jgi:Icc protein